jgi:hypothetical protein
MSRDPKITNTLLYGEGLCREQRLSTAYVWDDDWLVVADQLGKFGTLDIKHVAVRFYRRLERERYVAERIRVRVKELEDA